MQISDCLFLYGMSAIGGAIYIAGQGNYNIQNSKFINNKALTNGGAIFAQNFQSIYIVESTFKDCQAQVGGAIYIENQQILTILSSKFINNQALNSVNQNNQQKNQGSGGSIYHSCEAITLNCQLIFNGSNQFLENHADVQGGALFWDSVEPYLLEQPQFKQNTAIYYALKDNYGQIVGSDSKSKVIISFITDNLNSEQSKYPPNIEGQTEFLFDQGVTIVKDTNLIGTPGQQYVIKFQTDALETLKQQNQILKRSSLFSPTNLDINLELNFRQCLVGEYFTVAGKCIQCEVGYSLIEMNEPGSCMDCKSDRAICLGGSHIGPLPGYWRMNVNSSTFIKCRQEKACLGMIDPNNNPLGECERGYQGVLCADCQINYYQNILYQCEKCPEIWRDLIKLISVMIAIVLISVLMIRNSLKTQTNLETLQWSILFLLSNVQRLKMNKGYTLIQRSFVRVILTRLTINLLLFQAFLFGEQVFHYSIIFSYINFLFFNVKKQPFYTQALNDIESISLISQLAFIFVGLFFLLNKSQDWIDQNPDQSKGAVTLSREAEITLFICILVINLLFIVFWIKEVIIELKQYLREKMPKLYIQLFLCNNDSLFQSQVQKYQDKQGNLRFYELIKREIENDRRAIRSGNFILKKNISQKINNYLSNEQIIQIVNKKALLSILTNQTAKSNLIQTFDENKANNNHKNLTIKKSVSINPHLSIYDQNSKDPFVREKLNFLIESDAQYTSEQLLLDNLEQFTEENKELNYWQNPPNSNGNIKVQNDYNTVQIAKQKSYLIQGTEIDITEKQLQLNYKQDERIILKDIIKIGNSLIRHNQIPNENQLVNDQSIANKTYQAFDENDSLKVIQEEESLNDLEPQIDFFSKQDKQKHYETEDIAIEEILNDIEIITDDDQ
ncbi:UNKNOWN [Stylonychia lemnae]|uniref:Transmembrane protein n=1 Tax=Stylonychia lemnae TaxID=5949 RepID=A0A077ZUU2_STYLE|nr:UNKNOWN [Stylonychia lemnae]|eukprot:CDW72226.1 UNKNOWN [Stylonychia lemnae]